MTRDASAMACLEIDAGMQQHALGQPYELYVYSVQCPTCCPTCVLVMALRVEVRLMRKVTAHSFTGWTNSIITFFVLVWWQDTL